MLTFMQTTIIEDLKLKVQTYEAKVSESEATLRSVEELLNQTSTSKAIVENDLEESVNKCSKMHSIVLEKDRRIEELQTESQEHSLQASNLSQALAKSTDEIENLQTLLKEAEERKRCLEESVESLTNALKKETDTVNMMRDSDTATLADASEKMQQLQDEIDEWRRKTEAMVRRSFVIHFR
jgi:predicted  nucleic acid-binding Zn-ribbon protein